MMNTLKDFNKALVYIEDHLFDNIDSHRLAKLAGCSDYHFRRMFSFLAGMGLGEYIRRRKLSIAATRLQVDQEKVIDVALSMGYESPEAFSKAFHSIHGISPSQAKKTNASLISFPPMTFQLTIKGGNEMEYRLVEKEAFNIIGFKKRITLQYKGVNPQMEALTQKLTPSIISDLKNLSNIEPIGILSVSANFSDRITDGSELDQYIGVASSQPSPIGYDCLCVEPSLWVVFTVVGPFSSALQDTWAKIYSEWFPTSGYELSGGPELLWNESPDTSRLDYKSEIWIPVRKPSI